MCGRYTLRASADVLSAEFHLTVVPPMRARYNVAPTQEVAVVTDTRPTEVQLFRWGLVPGWAKDLSIGNKLINARGETLAEKPSFRNALKRRRCLVLADGFFEWRADGKRKTPIFIRHEPDRPFAIAGLWEEWKAPDGQLLHTCTLVTTQPNTLMAQYHDRMPVILPPEARTRWLAAGPLSEADLAALLVPYSGEDLVAHPVSPIVNMPANDVPACIAPA